MFRIRVILSLACLFVSDLIAEPPQFDAFERSIPEPRAAVASGETMTRADLEAQAPVLFAGWDEIEVVSLAD